MALYQYQLGVTGDTKQDTWQQGRRDMTRPLTHLAHELLSPVIGPGDQVVDATVGNGHDTCFLAECVSETGRVLGLDIQESALRVTRSRLDQAGLGDRVELVQSGHEGLERLLPGAMRGRLRAAMFNLGYLPGGDHNLVTRPDTTLTALSVTLAHLLPDGLISVMIYRGHAGGDEEYRAIEEWLDNANVAYRFHDRDAGPDHAPRLLHLWNR